MIEEWRNVKGYEGLYEVSNCGRIRRKDNGSYLHGNINSYGYIVVALSKSRKKKDYKLHRLVAIAFIENPNGFRCVNHKDGNKLNNSVTNLEWCTHGENNTHARTELQIDFSKKSVVQSTLSGKTIACWTSANVAAQVLNLNRVMISACCRGTAQSAYGYKWQYLHSLLEE